MNKKDFYKLLTEIHNRVSDEACGCMGGGYTEEKVQLHDTHTYDYNKEKRNNKGQFIPGYSKSKESKDYIGNIIRKYISII